MLIHYKPKPLLYPQCQTQSSGINMQARHVMGLNVLEFQTKIVRFLNK